MAFPKMNGATWIVLLVASSTLHAGPIGEGDQGPAAQARTDQYGDPLPLGAIARIGTERFRGWSTLWSVAFSPDGSSIIAVGQGVYFWDARTGRTLKSWEGVRPFKLVEAIDAVTRKSTRRWEGMPPYNLGKLSADGKKLWLHPHQGELWVWDLERSAQPVLAGYEGVVTGVVLPHPNGKELVIGERSDLRVWDIATKKVVRELAGQGGRHAVFSRDGKLLACGANEVSIWNTDTWQQLQTFGAAEQFTLSPDGKIVALSQSSKGVALLDAMTGKEMRFLPADDKAVQRLVFSPDGTKLVQATQWGTRLWDVSTGQELWPPWPPPRYGLFDAAFSPDGKTLAALNGSTVRLFDVASGREICPIAEQRLNPGRAILTPNGRMVITTDHWGGYPDTGSPFPEPRALRYWDAQTGCRLIGADKAYPPYAGLSADARLLVTWAKNKLQCWQRTTGEIVGEIPFATRFPVCALSANGKRLVLQDVAPSGQNKVTNLQLWDPSNGRQLAVFDSRHPGIVWLKVLSPDGQWLATTGLDDHALRLWKVDEQDVALQTKRKQTEMWFCATFSRDSRLLAAAGNFGEVQLWNVVSAKELPPLTGETVKAKSASGIYTMAFTPDGKRLFTADNFGRVYLWEVAKARLLCEWQAHPSRVGVLSVSHDGKSLMTQGAHTALVWDVDEVMRLHKTD